MKTQRGFSLVELMVAVVLGLLVTDGVISMFVSVRSAQRTTSGVAAVADNGRFGLNFIETAVRSAGAMGCNSTLRQNNILSAGSSPIYTDLNEAMAGYEASGTGPAGAFAITTSPTGDANQGDWTTIAALGGQLDALLEGLAVKGSDVLVVHETWPSMTPTYLSASAANASSMTVASTTGFAANQMAILTDCTSSWAFRTGAVGGNSIAVGNNAQGTITGTYNAGSQLTVADTLVYFIGVGQDGDGALFVMDAQGSATSFAAPTELVPDIENMQVLYGIDTTGGLAATEYVTATQVATNSALTNFNGAISVKVALLAASPPGSNSVPKPAASPMFNLLGATITAPIDTRFRQVFTATIATRNTTS